ncbi:MAG: hypothetical protein AUJ12_08530 [Alphaproteobacteria bacterium CG1_02_46_17]|nr:MAG: hypothetical protein AUJ12_08530 [Alphaproteobacteria bacterium CG1_02_46_17]
MDNTTGAGDTGGTQDTELQIWPQAVCRFAYTLNNSQPVRCTWISDQPLFYTDFDEVEEDDFLLDDPVLQALERDIADLREKANAYDKIAKDFEISETAKIDLFRLDAENLCAPAVASSEDKLESLFSMIKDSRLASQYLSFAQLNNIELRLSNQVMDAAYDRESRLILVREDMDLVDQTLLAARELRRMYQHRHGAGLHPLALHPDFAVLVNRAQTADLAVSMVRVAWELQLAGHKDVWARIEHSPTADLGRAFAREAITDFRSIQNGTAARTIFESWFLSERCRKADRLLIQQMLADYQGYSFSDNIEASRVIAIDLIKALGSMPFGQNYTESVVSQIMVDPIFTDVRDRSNANFLWFIKFERSFAEAEKEVSTKKEAKKQVKAQVLEFPQRKTTQSSVARAVVKGNGQVVELSRVGQD